MSRAHLSCLMKHRDTVTDSPNRAPRIAEAKVDSQHGLVWGTHREYPGDIGALRTFPVQKADQADEEYLKVTVFFSRERFTRFSGSRR